MKAALTDVADSQTTEDVGADSDVTKHSASADSEATSPADKRKAKRSVAGKGKTKSEADKRKTKVSGAAKQKTQSKPKPSVEKSVSKRSVAEKRAEPSATESDKPSDALVLFEKKVKPRRASGNLKAISLFSSGWWYHISFGWWRVQKNHICFVVKIYTKYKSICPVF